MASADSRWDACLLQPKCCWKAWSSNSYSANCAQSGWCITCQGLAAKHCSNKIIFQTLGGMPNSFWGSYLFESLISIFIMLLELTGC